MRFNQILTSHHEAGPGFDFLRTLLALSVMFWHCFCVTHSMLWTISFLSGTRRGILFILVPAFFAISGFLIAGSILRLNNIRTFLTYRILRIIPALFTEVCLSALLLGPIVTEFPLKDYFSSPEFWKYFSNIIGEIKYTLPGVFYHNINPYFVNGALWTVPYELYCYAAVTILFILKFFKSRVAITILFISYSIFVSVWGPFSFLKIVEIYPLSADALVLCFFSGILLFLWKDRIIMSKILWIIAFVVFQLSIYVLGAYYFLLGPMAIAYVIVSLGLKKMPRVPILMRGDYSYGIYIYSFPIQQLFIWLLPELRNPFLLFMLALPVTLGVAMLSWRWIEKPALNLRKRSTLFKTQAYKPES